MGKRCGWLTNSLAKLFVYLVLLHIVQITSGFVYCNASRKQSQNSKHHYTYMKNLAPRACCLCWLLLPASTLLPAARATPSCNKAGYLTKEASFTVASTATLSRSPNPRSTRTQLSAIRPPTGNDDNSTSVPEQVISTNTTVPTSINDNITKSTTMLSSYLPQNLTPRARSVVYMGLAMALHFGGYEFIRNACLALLTSQELQFPSITYPVANGLVSPFSLLLLYGYGRQLQAVGPRGALYRTTAACIAWIVIATLALMLCASLDLPLFVQQAIVLLTFLFQSSYQYLLYTQHWSFVSSVMTPQEGARWFAALAGWSSLFCTFTGFLVPHVSGGGLLGLLVLTAAPLTGALLASDAAYALAQEHGFDPSEQQRQSGTKTSSPKLGKKAVDLFRRVPTLRVLLTEVLSFQSLNTILSVALVAALPQHIPDDLERSAFTGRMYATINGLSAFLQFVVLPFVMKYTEPAWIWRVMPTLAIAVCGTQALSSGGTVPLSLLATAFSTAKVLDYAVRNVVYVMVYQPLDYESRYMGKEIIGVFGSRFGKSGMSWVLSLLAILSHGATSTPEFLSKLSLGGSILWGASSCWLSTMLPKQAEAQAVVEERQQRQRQQEQAGTEETVEQRKDTTKME